MNENNEKCMEIIKKLSLNPRIVTHEPILNYEVAQKVDKELNLTGTETKSLFLKGKSGNYYLFITLSNKKMNEKLLKNMLGEKIRLVSGDEMIELTGMKPGCMTPFGLKEGLITSVVIDPKIYNEEKLILAFGSETMSMEIESNEFKKIMEDCYSNLYDLQEEVEEDETF